MANLLPEIGLVLLTVDVLTDTIDVAARIVLTRLVQGETPVNELTAKKLCMLGVMMLVTTYRWKRDRPQPLASLNCGQRLGVWCGIGNEKRCAERIVGASVGAGGVRKMIEG